MQKIKSYLKNPITIFSFMTLLLSFILMIGVSFHMPDFYTNRTDAFNIAQTVSPSAVGKATMHLESIKHKIFNTIFQFWGWFLTLLGFSLIFKIRKFKDFLDIKLFHNKIFIYTWINISYIIYCVCILPAYMLDLEKYVYNGSADSMGIPFFNELFSLLFIALIYYPAINLLFFVKYNTKIKRRFYDFIFILCGLYFIWNTVIIFLMQFSYYHLFLNIYNLIWLLLIVYSLKLKKA